MRHCSFVLPAVPATNRWIHSAYRQWQQSLWVHVGPAAALEFAEVVGMSANTAAKLVWLIVLLSALVPYP